MFKFKEYPEINKAHKISRDWDKKAYQAEFECERSGGSIDKSKKWQDVIDEGKAYDEYEYPRVIYEVFSPIKPDLTLKKNGKIVKWDKIFKNKPFEELNSDQRSILLMLVEYERPYVLPAEYYDNRDRRKEMLRGNF